MADKVIDSLLNSRGVRLAKNDFGSVFGSVSVSLN